ncbi:MAG TPA: 2-hydroxyacyl-CoA dehydratase family protein [Bryobacteraceae bacterium]|jgi:benzoyl-CoA reductase subunit B|nr:2-hydroxyacyl-CoA dehydratase family protein [Bryobacteraceae bacterium]
MAEKQLESTIRAAAHQKAWFAQLRQDVFEKQKPYAIVQADMPLELFHAIDIPVVSNQWWAAMVSAKRLAPLYLDGLNAMGYHDGLCRYCSLSLASTIAGNPAQAPWGGLPKPTLLSARLTCDCIQRVFETWAAKLGAPFVPLDAPGASELPPRWWELSRYRWNELFEGHRLDFMVSQFQSLIRTLERITGKMFDLERLRVLMEGVNEQEQYFEEVREMICQAPRTPVRMHEQVSNVMAAQWLRGSDWAIAHARAFRDEVKERVEADIAACPSERLRLMWVGAGLWHDTDFYTAFEEQYGAVFVWSMYLAFGPDGYIRYGLDDPLRALASRTVSFNEQLHNPPWANEWIVDQARKHRIDAALVLEPLGTRPSATGNLFIERALQAAGVPVLPIAADMVDARGWNALEMRQTVARFLDRL